MQTKQTIAILGATGNMGSALAKSLARGNYRLLLKSSRQEALNALMEAIRAETPSADIEGTSYLSASRMLESMPLPLMQRSRKNQYTLLAGYQILLNEFFLFLTHKKTTQMKKLTMILSAFVLLTAFTAMNGLWKNDDPHSQLGFTVTHLGISDISGTFNDFDVEVTASQPDFSDAVFELTAKVASIDTRVDARDNHLKSADFFDAEKYPTLTFKSTGLKKAGKDQYKLTGNLTMHGVTKPVTMDLAYKGTVENPTNKKQTAGFQLTGTLKRSDFGIGEKFPAAMVSDEVRIKADGEFVQ